MSLNKTSIAEERVINGNVFPLTVTPNARIGSIEDTVEFIKGNLNEIQDELKKHGALLFRGFPIKEPKDFNDFALAFGWENLPYIGKKLKALSLIAYQAWTTFFKLFHLGNIFQGGAAVRKSVCGVVFTSNEAPPDQLIPFHHEMAQTPIHPFHLFFYCDIKPTLGGETPLCLSNAVYEAMCKERPLFVEKLKQKGLKYTRVLPEEDDPSSPIGRGWKSTYLTQDKKEAEQLCVRDGGSFEWLPNNCPKVVSKILPAVRLDERTGQMTWFNSMVAVYHGWRDSRNSPEKAVTYGDDSPLDPADVLKCSQVLDELCVTFEWNQGDVVVIDNRLVLHARKSFTPPRRILAALFK
jgi:alpha-ketoglutarate-dependent taurine dioxygenase